MPKTQKKRWKAKKNRSETNSELQETSSTQELQKLRNAFDRIITPTPPQTNDADTQTEPEPVQATEPHPLSINKKAKTANTR